MPSSVYRICAALALLLLPAQALAVEQPLTVVQAMPRDQVDNLTQITVRFSENMRPLGQMEEDAATSPLELTVQEGTLPAGNYRWLDPACLAYLFDQPIEAPVRIKARVPAGVKALSGHALAKEYAWNVSTPPLVLTVSEQVLPPEKAQFTITANYALDLDTLRKNTVLKDGQAAVPLTITDMNTDSPYEGQRSRWHYQVEINQTLGPNRKLTLTLGAGITAAAGGQPAKGGSFTLATYQELKVVSWRAGHEGKNKAISPEEGVRIEFNNPVLHKDILDHLTITPQAGVLREYAEDDRDQDISSAYFTLPFQWAPNTQYKLTLKAGLKDAYGSVLDRDQTFSFATGDYWPLFYMDTGQVVLERGLGGLFPLYVRNVDKIDVRLLYAPWADNPQPDLIDQPQTYAEVSRLENLKNTVKRDLTLDFSKQRNQNLRHTLNLPELLGLSGPEALQGMVYVQVVLPERKEGERRYYSENYYAAIQLTNLGLEVKAGQDDGLVWVNGLDDAKARGDVELTLLDLQGKTLWQGQTNAQGLAKLPGRKTLPEGRLYLSARSGPDWVMVNLNDSTLPTSYYDQVAREPKDRLWNIHALTQLPLYQPGQEVNYVVYARVFDHVPGQDKAAPDWRALSDRKLELVVKDSHGQEVHQQSGVTNKYGSLAGSFVLDEAANLGWYSIQAKIDGQRREVWAQAMQVASFRPPEFKVDLQAPASQPVPLERADPLQANLSAEYFSGASMAGAASLLQASQNEIAFTPPALSGFKTGYEVYPWFGRDIYYPGRDHQRPKPLASINANLDEKGRAIFQLPRIQVQAGRTLNINLEATVTDNSGLTSQGQSAFVLHPSEYYVGIKGPLFIPLGKEATFELKTATWDNQPLSNKKVLLRAERSKPSDQSLEMIWGKEVNITAALGQKTTVTFDKAGMYYISAIIKDGAGRENVSRRILYVLGGSLEWLRLPPSDHLEIMTSKEGPYAPGETVQLACANPFDQATALITVERNGVRSFRVEEVSQAAPTFDLKLNMDDAPYVFATITLIKGRTAAPPEDLSGQEDKDAGQPQVKFGIIMLEVDSGAKPKLNATVSADKKEYRPGEPATATVRVSDPSGQPVKTQVTLLAVDDRILRAAGENLRYNPAQTFVRIYSYGVINQSILTRLLNLNLPILNEAIGPMAAMAAPAPDMARAKEAMDVRSGGGESQDTDLRQNFSFTPLWLAEGETDASGLLRAEFTWPDSLTSYRLVAIAADAASCFSESQATVRVSKPLQLVSAMPRFLTQGDSLEAGILVQNLSASTQSIAVEATAENLTLGQSSRTIRLAAGQSGLVSFTLTAGQPGQGIVKVRGQMGQESDAARFIIPIKPALPLTTVAAAGLLKPGQSESIALNPPLPLDSRSRLAVIFAASPAAGLSLTAQDLLEYPWQCLEQRLSRTWVRAMRLSHGPMIGLTADPDDRQAIQDTLKDVPKFQRPDGGFSVWAGFEQSNFYLTAYVLLVNSQLKSLDMSLPTQVETRAVQYLSKALAGRYLDKKDKDPGWLEADSLALWLLSQKDADLAVKLFPEILSQAERAKDINPMTWAGLLLSARQLTSLPEQGKQMDRVVTNLEKLAAQTPTQLHFAAKNQSGYWMTMGSTLRDNGLALAALSQVRPGYVRLEALAAWVSQGLGEKKVLSTQEAIFGLWGLISYLQGLGGDKTVTMRADWPGSDSMTHTFKKLIEPPETWIIPADRLTNANLTMTALEGDPYWTARLTYASESLSIQPEQAGFTLTREWKTPGPWAMGDLVEVSITMTVPATRRHVLLFDPFPAGLEPVHASRVDLAEAAKTYQHPWQWEEARDDGMLLYASSVNPGTYTYTYTLRAAAAGHFVQRPSQVEEMYTPEVFGRTSADQVEIRP